MTRDEMQTLLTTMEQRLPSLLEQWDGWSSLDIDYEPPRVQRLWRQVGDVRLLLHCIFPCEHPLFHPHPWPSAVKVLAGGEYEMELGYTKFDSAPPVAAMVRLAPGSSYIMVDPDGWHSVRPIGAPSFSIMIVGQPWERWRWSPGKKQVHSPLFEEDEAALFGTFRRLVRGEAL